MKDETRAAWRARQGAMATAPTTVAVERARLNEDRKARKESSLEDDIRNAQERLTAMEAVEAMEDLGSEHDPIFLDSDENGWEETTPANRVEVWDGNDTANRALAAAVPCRFHGDPLLLDEATAPEPFLVHHAETISDMDPNFMQGTLADLYRDRAAGEFVRVRAERVTAQARTRFAELRLWQKVAANVLDDADVAGSLDSADIQKLMDFVQYVDDNLD